MASGLIAKVAPATKLRLEGACAGNVIVCAPLSTVNVFVTGIAVAKPKLVLPPCVAVSEHTPAVCRVTFEPATVQIAGVLPV